MPIGVLMHFQSSDGDQYILVNNHSRKNNFIMNFKSTLAWQNFTLRLWTSKNSWEYIKCVHYVNHIYVLRTLKNQPKQRLKDVFSLLKQKVHYKVQYIFIAIVSVDYYFWYSYKSYKHNTVFSSICQPWIYLAMVKQVPCQ